ncbi:hypothetical protein LZP73_00035 [Shewanella sp. AS16]|uniref:hypothetical protein n=1 Tax=Shewanella sp. AS16 TaxID=2907625 RepID=UPI001F194A32|nr:hypothetical protein [Shewanella sp. AS16]MCE9684611.1 hypothetical protein [Shewanella sp. AS16]
MTQQEFYSILSSPELLKRMEELGVDKDRDKSLIFVVAVLAWIITGDLTGKLFGVELTGFVAGCFIVFFGNNVTGAFRLGVEQAILETVSALGDNEIKDRTQRLTEIEEQVMDPSNDVKALSESGRDQAAREYWISYTKFRRSTYQYVGLANIVNGVFILSILWTLVLGAKAVLAFL